MFSDGQTLIEELQSLNKSSKFVLYLFSCSCSLKTPTQSGKFHPPLPLPIPHSLTIPTGLNVYESLVFSSVIGFQ